MFVQRSWLWLSPALAVVQNLATDLERILMSGGVITLYTTVDWKPFGLDLEDLLSILIVPVVLAGLGYLFTWWQKNRDLKVEAQRLKNAQELEQQRAQDEVFQAYLDQLAEPLINGRLHESGRYSPLRVLARARTLGVLWKLDSNRKRSLMQFLQEAKLIRREELDRVGDEPVNPVIGLSGADLRDGYLRWLDLSKADLRGADLKGADLGKANLKSADLRGVDLQESDLRDALLTKAEDTEGADLKGADLRDANLMGADLRGADLEGALLEEGQLDESKSHAGATMPDASSEG